MQFRVSSVLDIDVLHFWGVTSPHCMLDDPLCRRSKTFQFRCPVNLVRLISGFHEKGCKSRYSDSIPNLKVITATAHRAGCSCCDLMGFGMATHEVSLVVRAALCSPISRRRLCIIYILCIYPAVLQVFDVVATAQ